MWWSPVSSPLECVPGHLQCWWVQWPHSPTHTTHCQSTLFLPSTTPVLHLSIQAVTGVLKDPLLTQQADRDTEQRIMSGNHSNDRSESRVAMDAVSWLAIQLIYIDSSVRERSRYNHDMVLLSRNFMLSVCNTYRQRVKKDHNEMQGGKEGVGMLKLPHKTPLSHHHSPLSLTWPQP